LNARSLLAGPVGDAQFAFVVGKGGVGKTTAAGALALARADAGTPTHLISTDPAHSIGDLFRQQLTGDVVASACTASLTLEAFDASAYGDRWLARALESVTQIIERGTYLDGADVHAFSRLALPGLDELMAVLRLVDLAREGKRVVVDTAPTGHTLRLLDAAATHAGIADALRAMADKAAAVAGSLAGRAVRLQGETIIDELQAYVDEYRARVLRPAAFIIATRAGAPVVAETRRLADALHTRGLNVVASIAALDPVDIDAPASLFVPHVDDPRGCHGLRRWSDAVQTTSKVTHADVAARTQPAAQDGAAEAWIVAHAKRVLLFAGKGGVGKSSCAAAAAVALAQDRDVLLCSADPAGSLHDILDSHDDLARLRVLQIEPDAQLARLRDAYRADVIDALAKLGLSQGAALDRRVIESMWELTPPGLDELAAISAMIDAAESHETIVLDAAPTGHFLRLLETPELALAWTHQLMRVIVKYGIAGTAGGAAGALLQLARELRALRALLHDANESGVFVVTLDEPLVRAETDRLLDTLRDAAVPVQALLLNRFDGRAPAYAAAPGVTVYAPLAADAPVGVAALREWMRTWKIVA